MLLRVLLLGCVLLGISMAAHAQQPALTQATIKNETDKTLCVYAGSHLLGCDLPPDRDFNVVAPMTFFENGKIYQTAIFRVTDSRKKTTAGKEIKFCRKADLAKQVVWVIEGKGVEKDCVKSETEKTAAEKGLKNEK